jgi:signal recognition particle receptor subunit beta
LLPEEQLIGRPILVFANKQDLAGALSHAQVAEALKLIEIKDRAWQIQASCAKTGDGLKDGLEWLMDAISTSKS